VFLADFGLSTDARVSEAFECGSAYYMSPGQPLFSSSSSAADRIGRVHWQRVQTCSLLDPP
jgi:hypothetical protein